ISSGGPTACLRKRPPERAVVAVTMTQSASASARSGTIRAMCRMSSPRVESLRASASSRSASGATRTRLLRPKLRMIRAVAPILAAICGLTSTTRQLFNDIDAAIAGWETRSTVIGFLEGDLLEPFQIELAGTKDWQIRHLEKVALAGNPQIRQSLAIKLLANGLYVLAVQIEVKNDEPFSAFLIRHRGHGTNTLI